MLFRSYSIKSKNIKSIKNYAAAKARYESIKPLRGRVSDVRPLGPRRYTYIRIERINQNLARLADGKSVRFLNINDQLADKAGVLFDGVTGDKLHLSLKGYEIWAAGLKPILTELLGPPAATDRAPPPTGDPSAKKK